MANVFDGYIDYSDVLSMSFTPREREKFFLEIGDVLLNEGQSLELVGRSAIFEGPSRQYCFQNTIVRFRCHSSTVPEVARAVFKRWLDTRRFTRVARQTTSVAHLGADRFANMELVLPPLPEQHRLAEILDTVDEAIRKTEQVIAKLQQMKQGLLHDLLTRGIDDNGELRNPDRHPEQFKDSPLGRIPRKWEVEELGRHLDGIDAGKSPSLQDAPARRGQWGVLKVSAVHPGGFRPNENKVVHDRRLVNPTYEVRHGDLLMTRANTYELVGLVCLVESPPQRLLLCDKTLRLHVSASCDPEFIFHASQMQFIRRQIEMHATGSSGSMKNISQRAIRGLRFPVPGTEEQRQIARILRGQSTRITRESRGRLKLHDLKCGLMDDLLTGRVRIQVHEEAAT